MPGTRDSAKWYDGRMWLSAGFSYEAAARGGFADGVADIGDAGGAVEHADLPTSLVFDGRMDEGGCMAETAGASGSNQVFRYCARWEW